MVTKIGLSGACAAFTPSAQRSIRPRSITAAFSVPYALMGYNVTYFFNIMWLDAVILAPLVASAIEGLVEDGGAPCSSSRSPSLSGLVKSAGVVYEVDPSVGRVG